MKTISTTGVHKGLVDVVEEVKKTGHTMAIDHRGHLEAYLVPASHYNPNLSQMTNLSMGLGSFAFLLDEPDLYTKADIIRPYGGKRK